MTGSPAETIASFAKGVWWLVLLRGVLAILLGIMALVAPIATTFAFVFVFAAYAVVDGVFLIVHAIGSARRRRPYGWTLTGGIVSLLAGLGALIFPLAAGWVAAAYVLVLLWIIAIDAVLHGVLTLTSPPQLGFSRGWSIAAGVVNILFGILMAVLLFANPGTSILAFIWVVAVWAILFGITLIAAAFRVRAAAGAGRG